jgi:signal peptidase
MSHSLTRRDSAELAKKAAAELKREKKAAAAEAAEKASIWHVIRTGLSLGIFAIVLGLVSVIVIIPKVLGATPLTILTSSMEPGLPPGTLIVVEPVAPENIVIGDVITYQIESGEAAVVTHRILEVQSSTIGEPTFILQGDNNAEPDPPVTASQIQGRLVYSLPWVGNLSSILNGPARATLLPILAGAMVLYAAVSIVIGLVGLARKKRRVPRHAGPTITASAKSADETASAHTSTSAHESEPAQRAVIDPSSDASSRR